MISILKTLVAGLYVVLVFLALSLATGLLSIGQPLLAIILKTVVLFGILLRIVQKKDLEHFGRHLQKHGPWLLLYLLGSQGLWLVLATVLQKLPWWWEQYRDYEKDMMALPLLTAQVLLAPLGEEVIFRWLYVKTVEKMNAFNIVVVTLLGGLSFALVHHPAMWPFALVHGLFLVWYYATYRDLLMVILLHFSINLINVI